MQRLFNAHVRLVYEHEHGEVSMSSSVADRTEFWWNERKPNEPSLWESKIELGEKFFPLAIRAGYEATVTLDAYPSTRFSASVVDFSSIASTGDDPLLLPSGTANRYVRHFPARILIKDQDARILPDLSASAIVQLPAVERGVIVPRGDRAAQ